MRWQAAPAFASFRFQARANVRSPSVMIIWIFSPIIMGSVIALLYRSLGADHLIPYALLGTIVAGTWTTSLFLTAITLGNDRWSGVLELTLATPAPMSVIMIGKLLAGSFQGLIAAAVAISAVILVSRTLIDIERPLLLVASLPIVMVGVSALALAFSPLLYLTRGAVGIFALLDSGLMFLSAVFYPLSTLPGWVQPLALLSPLRWSSEAFVATASTDHTARDTVEAWAAIAALTVLYGAWGIIAYVFLERRLRRTGELSTF